MIIKYVTKGSPGSTVIKNLSASAGDARDAGLVSGSGRCPGEGNDNPLHYFCLENPMNRGRVWWAIAHGVEESDMTKCTCAYTQCKSDCFLIFLYCQV